MDVCRGGVCGGTALGPCVPLDQCHVAGTRDPATGACSNPATPDGAPCDDGNACTSADACKAGVCVPGTPVTCTALDACHLAGVCDPASGLCSSPVVPGSCERLPPDPATVAPPIPAGVATDFSSATSFLFTGPNPIQTGVAAETIVAERAAVVRGRALRRDGSPLPGATVKVLGHPELGGTLTRADGMFDLAVNGGGLVTIDLSREGFLPAQRAVQTAWHDYARLADAVLIPLDAAVTVIGAGVAAVQVAQGSPVADIDGARQATLLFPSGTQAGMTLRDGTSRSLSTLHVRATEYTVGPSGPNAMPGSLPPASAYTYAAELSVDEAIAANATGVTFNQAVPVYLENFLGLPVGTTVPVGFYEPDLGVWVPSESGLVVGVLGVSGGLALIDVQGLGIAADADALGRLGITDEERASLASLYPVGASLWRSPVRHFSKVDFNLGSGPPGSGPPNPPGPAGPRPPPKKPDCSKGSIIACESQALLESVPVAGTPLSLVYDSDRSRPIPLDIPLSGATVPPTLKRIELTLTVAGRTTTRTFPPQPNLSYPFVWDRRDAYGRLVRGGVTATIEIQFIFDDARYSTPSSFGAAGPPGLVGRRSPGEISYLLRQAVRVGRLEDEIQPGWSLSHAHALDIAAGEVALGTGGRQSTTDFIARIVTAAAGRGVVGNYLSDGDGLPAQQAAVGRPAGLAAAPDGTIYLSDAQNSLLRNVGRDGLIRTVAGKAGAAGFSGDGGPAADALLGIPTGLAVAPDGSILFLDTFGSTSRVRRIDPGGVITTVASAPAPSGYNSIAAAPDGNVYLGQPLTRAVVRLDPSGKRSVFAGGNNGVGPSGDGGLATAATLDAPLSLAVGPDGSVYIGCQSGLRRVDQSGFISTVAGQASGGLSGDGGPAALAEVNGVGGVLVTAEGEIVLADTNNGRIRLISLDGYITTIAGNGAGTSSGDNGPPQQASFREPTVLALGKDGSIYVADLQASTVRRLRSPESSLGAQVLVAAADGQEIRSFDLQGRHVATLDPLTGAPRLRFAYDAQGRLGSLTDAGGNQTTLERDAAGNLAAIVAPGGQRTRVVTDASGQIVSIQDPTLSTWQFSYGDGGLMSTEIDPEGGTAHFGYDSEGGLVSDQDARGGVRTLARTQTADGGQVVVTSPLGATTVHAWTQLPGGDVRRTMTQAGGAVTETLLRADGSRRITHPDGTVVDLTYQPDPRWGMTSPLLAAMSIAIPGAPPISYALTRNSVLGDPHQVLSLASQTDTVTVNGATAFTTVYSVASSTVTTTTAGGRVSSVTLDALGRIIARSTDTAAGVAPVGLAYDSSGRLSRVAQGDRSFTYAYDAQGQLASVTDATGAILAYSRDGFGRVSQELMPSGRSYRYAHDGFGRQLALQMPGGGAYATPYSAIGEPLGYSPPGGAAYSRSWDADSRILSSTLPGGRTTSAQYDAAGRLSLIAFPEGVIDFGYAAGDPSGRAITISRTPSGGAAAILGFSWAGDLVTSVAFSGPASGQYSYTWDGSLNLIGMNLTAAAGTTAFAIVRDADGLPTALGPYALTRNGPFGSPTAVADGAFVLNLAYDTEGRIRDRKYTNGGAAIYDEQLDFDRAGRITGVVETLGASSSTLALAYDPDGQLVGVTRDGTAVEQYAYDANGNRTSRRLGAAAVETAAFDSQDRLQAQGAVAYQVTTDGFLVRRGTDSFTYSARGELLSATTAAGTSTYAYDSFGRRLSWTCAAGTTQFLYGNPEQQVQLTASIGPAGEVTAYVYDDGGRLLGLQRGPARYRVAVDHLGSPRVVVDGSGAVVKVLTWDSFGDLVGDSAPDFQLWIGFAGGLVDPTTGFVRFGLRDYDPATGRWTARDPIAFGGGQANLYAYVNNDPTGRIDLSGLVSVAASAYDVLGGGGKFAVTGKGVSFCFELGAGLGESLELDPSGELDETEMYTTSQLAASLGPLAAAELDVDLKDCHGRLIATTKAKGCVGPDCRDTNGAASIESAEVIKDRKDLFAKPKLSVQGKVAAVFCQAFAF